jgi:hypothetical protein
MQKNISTNKSMNGKSMGNDEQPVEEGEHGEEAQRDSTEQDQQTPVNAVRQELPL